MTPSFLCLFKDLKEAFKIFDKNKNGFIEMKELRMVTTTLGQKLTEWHSREGGKRLAPPFRTSYVPSVCLSVRL